AWLLKNRLIDETGLLKEPYSIGPDSKISVNQQDIREIQLAKSAICSGIRILMKVTESAFDEIDALYLAGGFGNYINIDSAIGIGLLPAEMRGKIFPVGNSAGIGALQYLKSDEIDKRISGLLENSEYIELSNYDEFMTEFAMNMDFPGK
ncbi:MAG TPA: ASKHA domain-containing protein, partial [Bacteroidales bacterium]|nr:ASKHA domain-containing protein [Bacteroidales bacterium]